MHEFLATTNLKYSWRNKAEQKVTKIRKLHCIWSCGPVQVRTLLRTFTEIELPDELPEILRVQKYLNKLIQINIDASFLTAGSDSFPPGLFLAEMRLQLILTEEEQLAITVDHYASICHTLGNGESV